MLSCSPGSTNRCLEGHGPCFGLFYTLLGWDGHAFGTLSSAFTLRMSTICPGLSLHVLVKRICLCQTNRVSLLHGWVYFLQVYPIIDFPDPEISLASQRAVAEHSAAFATSSRILRQVRGEPGAEPPARPPAACCTPLHPGGQLVKVD